MNHVLHVAIHAILHVAYLLAATVAYGQVCQLRCENGSFGSAVCVGTYDATGDAVFLGAGHCCDGAVHLAPAGQWLAGDVLAYAADGPGQDLALIRVRGYRPKDTYRLGTTTPRVGERVVMAGFPRGGEFRSTSATIVGYGKGYFAMSASGVGGVSGGPILQGRTVVGILTHNHVERQQGEATNAETIQATLKAWGMAPGKRDATGWVGMGFGVGCGPGGCYRPAVPVYPQPVQPYYAQPVVPYQQPYAQPYVAAPQQPAYPGWQTPAEPQAPQQPQQPAEPQRPTAPDTTALDDLRKRIEQSDADTSTALMELRKAIAALRDVRGEQGPQGPLGATGPQGERGPAGPQGPAGRDANPAELTEVRQRLQRLESATIPVRIVDSEGKTVDERTYKLGEALEFRLVPRPTK